MADSPVIGSRLLAAHGIHGFFTTRDSTAANAFSFGATAGEQPAQTAVNIKRLVAVTGLSTPPHQAVQVHQCGHIWCSGIGNMHETPADILLTRNVDTAVAVRTADCLPILLADPEAGIAAAVHAGWRGTAAGVLTAAVETMLNHGASCRHIIASLGPCIGPCCFRIGTEAAQALADSVGDAGSCILQAPLRADLAGINRLQLMAHGIPKHHIEQHTLCTVCHAERFFSYRRDAELSGRQLAVVAIPSTT